MAQLQEQNPFASLESILKLIGTAKGSTTTQTSQSNISSEGASALIKQILQSTQGLAAVSSGQKSAGLYNSTVNQQLVNNLLSQVGTEVASKQVGTTTTTKTSGALSGKNAAQTGQLVAALQGASALKSLANPILARVGPKYGVKSVEDIGNKILDNIFGSPSGGVSLDPTPMTNSDWNDLGNAAIEGVQGGGSATGLLDFASTLEGTGGGEGGGGGGGSSVDLSAVDSASGSGSTDIPVDWNGNTDGGSLSDAEWNQMGDDAVNFSDGSESAAGSSDYAGGKVNYVKIAKYIDDPDSLNKDLSFNNKSPQEKVAGVANVVGTVFPLASFVGGAIRSTDALADTTVGLFRNPLKTTYDMYKLRDDMGEMVIADTNGIGASVASTVDLAGRAVETTGNAVGDVFQGIGNTVGDIVGSVGDAIGGVTDSIGDFFGGLF